MKIFLSGLDACIPRGNYILDNSQSTRFNLLSYYYINLKKENGERLFQKALKKSDEIIIDSGAFTFIHGHKSKDINWMDYACKYADWIQKHDNEKIIGFFELDIDLLVGYENVKKLRKILLQATNKIIPVWHRNRGFDEFKNMCREFSYVAIPGRRHFDAEDEDFIKFVNYAHSQNTKIHGLALTRPKVLNKIPFDSVDSASWAIRQANNKMEILKNKDTKQFPSKAWAKKNYLEMALLNYMKYVKLQNEYLERWSDYKYEKEK